MLISYYKLLFIQLLNANWQKDMVLIIKMIIMNSILVTVLKNPHIWYVIYCIYLFNLNLRHNRLAVTLPWQNLAVITEDFEAFRKKKK